MSTTKVSEPIPSGFSISTISSFKDIENKHDVYKDKDCMKKFCESLREDAMKIMPKRKNMKLLTSEQQESYENAKILYTCEGKHKNKQYHKVRDHCHYAGEYQGTALSICNLKIVYLKKLP